MSDVLNPNYLNYPQQTAENTANIEGLKTKLKTTQNLTSASTSVSLSTTNIGDFESVCEGNLIYSANGMLFRITAITSDTVYLQFYSDFSGDSQNDITDFSAATEDVLYETGKATFSGHALVKTDRHPTGRSVPWSEDLNIEGKNGIKIDASEDDDTLEVQLDETTVSNPNLLINGDFRVNQRGDTTYNFSDTYRYGKLYTVDRWRVVPQANSSTSTLTVNSNSITMYCADRYDNISQTIEDFSKLAGKTVTLSVKVKSITGTEVGFNARISVDNTSQGDISNLAVGINSKTYTLPSTISTSLLISVLQQTGSGGTIEIEWAKLEIGSVATAFSPRPYAEELALCQRYYNLISNHSLYTAFASGVIINSTTTEMIINLPQTLRTSPTFTISDITKLTLFPVVTSNANITSFENRGYSENSVTIRFTFDSSAGYSAMQPVVLRNASSNVKLFLDAEIY